MLLFQEHKNPIIYKIWMNLDDCLRSHERLFHKKHQKYTLWCNSRYVSSLLILPKKFFGSRKFKIFRTAQQNRQKHSEHFKLFFFFFTINFHLVTSNQISTCRKLTVSQAVFNQSSDHQKYKEDLNEAKYTTLFLTLSGKKQPTNLEKWQQRKPFAPVCMLLVQLA